MFIGASRLKTAAIICLSTGNGRYGYLRIHRIECLGGSSEVLRYHYTHVMWKKPGDR